MVKPSFVLATWRVLAFATWALAAITAYRARPQTKVEPSPVSVVAASTSPRALVPPTEVTTTATIEPVSALIEHHEKPARLAQRMSDASEAELSELTQALAHMGGLEAHEVLFRAASATRPALRNEALSAIATLDTPDARAFMLEQLQAEEPAAVTYFADCVDARAVPGLERVARNAAAELRSSAITALFAQGEPGSRAVMRLVDEGGELADAVLQSNVPTPEAHRALLTASIARLRRGGFGSGPVFDFLGHDFSSEGLNALVVAARDEATSNSAITALQTRGDAAALTVLARLANDSDRSVASGATCALVAAPDSRSRGYLLRIDERMRSAITGALVDIDAPEAASLIARMRVSPNADEREAALRFSAPPTVRRARRIR